LWNVQDVTVKRSPVKRALGIGDVVIDSAAATGKITLHNVRNPLRVSDEILRLAARK
jgi:membrane protein YdbS with pleckstrin-like domain